MNRQFTRAMFLLQMKKYADQECISVPNNGCFNYTLEHTTVCSSQNTDKRATHYIQPRQSILARFEYLCHFCSFWNIYWQCFTLYVSANVSGGCSQLVISYKLNYYWTHLVFVDLLISDSILPWCPPEIGTSRKGLCLNLSFRNSLWVSEYCAVQINLDTLFYSYLFAGNAQNCIEKTATKILPKIWCFKKPFDK